MSVTIRRSGRPDGTGTAAQAGFKGLGCLIAMLLAFAARDGAAQQSGVRTQTPSCPASLVAGGHDYHGLTFVQCNFNGVDLSKADFGGATLNGVIFVNANLAGAKFDGATIVDSGNAAMPTDFSFANLSNASFVGTKFEGLTYLTYASLTCADFSRTDLVQGKAVFGDDPLRIDTNQGCRTKFQGATMNCEFVAQWDQLDLSGANVASCASLLQSVDQKGHDFSGGIYTGVAFDGLDLTASKWTNAVLEHASFQGATLDHATGLNGIPTQRSRLSGARFNNASLKNVNLSNAQLYGAQFTNANLENASLQGALLSNNPQGTPPIDVAADFTGAHLKNVNLSGAQLQGTTFGFASFYGSFNVIGRGPPKFPCETNTSQCGTTRVTGYTCSCASAAGAALTRTGFQNAFLYGVDFGGSTTVINGVDFSNAILVGASFSGATFRVDPTQGGAQPKFAGAFLQGVDMTGALLDNTTLDGAYLDFRAGGNQMQVLLRSQYLAFRGWATPDQPACVRLDYTGLPTKVPGTTQNTTCPDGFQYPGGCGATPARPNANPWWKAKVDIGQASPPGFYVNDATYTAANQSGACNANTTNPAW